MRDTVKVYSCPFFSLLSDRTETIQCGGQNVILGSQPKGGGGASKVREDNLLESPAMYALIYMRTYLDGQNQSGIKMTKTSKAARKHTQMWVGLNEIEYLGYLLRYARGYEALVREGISNVGYTVTQKCKGITYLSRSRTILQGHLAKAFAPCQPAHRVSR